MSSLICAEVLACDAIEGRDKLKKIVVRVDDAGTTIALVTNAPNVETGKRLVVCPAGGTLRDGTEVRRATVGGCVSDGVVCDSVMCGWSGGGAGSAALLPGDFPLGSAAPSARPRLDGKSDDAGDDERARAAKKADEKAEKKAALAAKRAARDAAKKAKKTGADARAEADDGDDGENDATDDA